MGVFVGQAVVHAFVSASSAVRCASLCVCICPESESERADCVKEAAILAQTLLRMMSACIHTHITHTHTHIPGWIRSVLSRHPDAQPVPVHRKRQLCSGHHQHAPEAAQCAGVLWLELSAECLMFEVAVKHTAHAHTHARRKWCCLRPTQLRLLPHRVRAFQSSCVVGLVWIKGDRVAA